MSSRKADYTAADALARLMLAAKEDPLFRDHVMRILRLPTFTRESLVATAVREMALKGEDRTLCEAFAQLASDEVAKRALQELSSTGTA